MQTILRVKRLCLCLFVAALFSMPVMAQTDTQASPEPQLSVNQIDINTANEAQLSELTQVGKKKAQEIIRYREANGPFKTVDDLLQVKGIGQTTIEKNRARLLAGQ